MKINVSLPDGKDAILTPKQRNDPTFLAEDIMLAAKAAMHVYPEWTSLVIIIAKGDAS